MSVRLWSLVEAASGLVLSRGSSKERSGVIYKYAYHVGWMESDGIG